MIRMIVALVQKDVKLFFRNQFFALITLLGLAFYLLVYFMLPSTVEERLPFAVHVEGVAGGLTGALPLGEGELSDGLTIVTFDSKEALIAAVEKGDYLAGLVLPADALAAVRRAEPISLSLYYAPTTPSEVRDALNSVLTAGFNSLAGVSGVTRVTEVLGQPVDTPIPLRDRMLPTLVLTILAVEIMGLATLIVEEVEHRTAQAVLITPLGTPQFFASKAVMGIGLAFVQVFVIVAIAGKLAADPLLITLTLLIGCLLITGIGFLIAALSRDMMSVIGWGMLALIVLALPSFTLIFPSIGSGWMTYIPSYYLVDTLHRTINFSASLGDVAPNLLALLIIGGGTLVIGSVTLRRRFA